MPGAARVSTGKDRGKQAKGTVISREEATMLYNFRILTPRQQDAIRSIIFLFAEGKEADPAHK